MQFGQRAVNCIYMTSRYQFFRRARRGRKVVVERERETKIEKAFVGAASLWKLQTQRHSRLFMGDRIS